MKTLYKLLNSPYYSILYTSEHDSMDAYKEFLSYASSYIKQNREIYLMDVKGDSVNIPKGIKLIRSLDAITRFVRYSYTTPMLNTFSFIELSGIPLRRSSRKYNIIRTLLDYPVPNVIIHLSSYDIYEFIPILEKRTIPNLHYTYLYK